VTFDGRRQSEDDGSTDRREADPADGSRQQGGGADAAAEAAHHAALGRPQEERQGVRHVVQHDPVEEAARGSLQERGAGRKRSHVRGAQQSIQEDAEGRRRLERAGTFRRPPQPDQAVCRRREFNQSINQSINQFYLLNKIQ